MHEFKRVESAMRARLQVCGAWRRQSQAGSVAVEGLDRGLVCAFAMIALLLAW